MQTYIRPESIMERIIFHIDVNSAYLSWTAAERLKTTDNQEPDLRAIPSIVGGDLASRHGIVLAKSIPAKAYGIHTAEPVASAMRKCPTLTVVPPDHALYDRYSRKTDEAAFRLYCRILKSSPLTSVSWILPRFSVCTLRLWTPPESSKKTSKHSLDLR